MSQSWRHNKPRQTAGIPPFIRLTRTNRPSMLATGRYRTYEKASENNSSSSMPILHVPRSVHCFHQPMALGNLIFERWRYCYMHVQQGYCKEIQWNRSIPKYSSNARSRQTLFPYHSKPSVGTVTTCVVTSEPYSPRKNCERRLIRIEKSSNACFLISYAAHALSEMLRVVCSAVLKH